MLKFCKMKANEGDHEAIFLLATEYAACNNNRLAIKYFMKNIDDGYCEAACPLAILYGKMKNYDKMQEFAKIAFSQNDYSKGMVLMLADYHKSTNNYEEMVRLLEFAIDKSWTDAIHKLAKYYKSQKKYDKMVDCLIKGIELESSGSNKDNSSRKVKSCRSRLNNYFRDNHDYKNLVRAKKYLNESNMEDLNLIIKRYSAIKDIDFSHFLDSCCVCLDESVYHNYFRCGHGVCVDCFDTIEETCPYCRHPLYGDDEESCSAESADDDVPYDEESCSAESADDDVPYDGSNDFLFP